MQRNFCTLFIALGLLFGSINSRAAEAAAFLDPSHVSSSEANDGAVIPEEPRAEEALPQMEEKGILIDHDMRMSMLMEGTIPIKNEGGELLGTFEVKFLPGINNIGRDMTEAFKKAVEDLSSYLKGEEFWERDIWRSCTDSLKEGWRRHCEFGLGQFPEDLQKFKNNCLAIDQAEFAVFPLKCLEGMRFGGKCLCRAGLSLCAGGLAALESILFPVIGTLLPAVSATYQAGFKGVVLPPVKMGGHLIAWKITTVLYKKTPPQKDSLAVRWIPAEPALR